MFCPKCGNEVKEGAKFCNKCGNKMPEATVVEEVPAPEETPIVEEVPVVEEPPVVEEVPPVEEAPVVEEVPTVEEILAEESLSAEALSAEEQNLSVDEVLAQAEVLVEEESVFEAIPVAAAVPATKKETKKAAKQAKKAEKAAKKAEKKATKKKRKAWPWVVGILAVLLAAAVAFCYFFVNPYFAKKNAYEKGLACLEERDFDGALENFKKADDYEDAAQYYADLHDKETVYAMALLAMENGDYADAGEALDGLDDYKDAPALVQNCLYELAAACLADQNVEEAYHFADRMDDDTYDQFLQHYIISYADLQVFGVLEEMLTTRLEDESRSDLTAYDILRTENDGLTGLDALPAYADVDLEELVNLYYEGVQLQFGACSEEGYIDNHDFYQGAYNRAYAIEQLMEQYDFLAENETLAQAYEGAAELYEAVVNLQTALEEQLPEADTVEDANGKTYLPFKNTTETAAQLQFYSNFYAADTYVSGTESYLFVLPGETVYVPVEIPAAYDEWYIDWDFLEVYYGEELQPEAGVYKLQSMVVDGVFYDLEVLATAGVTPDSVVVTFKDDGTGTWKEMDIENAFSYSSSLIAIDGTDLRLPYSAAPGKIVVELDTATYVLTLESLVA